MTVQSVVGSFVFDEGRIAALVRAFVGAGLRQDRRQVFRFVVRQYHTLQKGERMQKLYRSLLAAGAVFGLAACGDDVTVTPPPDPVAIAITGITVSPPSATILVGQTTTISASVQTNGGAGQIDLTVTWSSSNTAVATVNATTGVVTGVSAGDAVITARSNGNNAYSAGSAIRVNAPAVLPNALLGLTVNPTAASVQAGSQVAVSTNVQTSPGATVTYANSYSNANCTGPATGANPTITAVTVGTCVVTITASGSGTGLISNSLTASVAVTITSLGSALQSLTVNPTSWASVPGASQVVTTTHAAAAGATVTYANSSSNTAVATVTSTGANPTITAVGNGTAQITITATGSGPNLNTNSISAQVSVNIQAASVSISSLTTCIDPDGPGPLVCAGPTPVNLAGVMGQIEATLNINSGNQQIASVAVFMGQPVAGSCTVGVTYTEAARQIFGVNGAPNAPVTLSINTAEFSASYVPKWLNGLECIQARLFPVSGPNPDASNTIQFTLTNPDVVYFNATVGTTGGAAGLHHTGNSAVQASGPANTWWRGGFTFRAHPVLYSGAANVVSIVYTSTACGAVAATAAPWTATFSCAGVESAQMIADAVTINYVPAYTLTVSPTMFAGPANPPFVPGNPVYAAITTREDNVGPRTHTPLYVAAGAGGWHGNGSAGVLLTTAAVGGTAAIAPTSYTVTATDFGVGGATAGFGLSAAPTITEMTTSVTFASGSTPAGIPLAETLNPVPYFLRGNSTSDILGNGGVATVTGAAGVVACGGGIPAGSTSICRSTDASPFGVDLMVLDAQYADRAASVTPNYFPGATSIWQGLNGRIYTRNAITGGVSPGVGATGQTVTDWDIAVTGPDGLAEMIAIDAIDTRSGLNNPTALTQKIVRRNAAGNTTCLAFGTYAMSNILADNYVQSVAQQFDCGLAAGARVGEYTWTGYVSDRAGNARLATSALTPPLTGAVTSLFMAIDEALPNITGIGFQTALYTGGQPATYSFSANDDLELWQGSVTLTYGGHAPINYPYGSSAYTTGAFGTPFDGTFVNVVNGAALTLGYYINQFDFATTAAFVPGGAPSGNVAGFASGTVNTGVTANVRDVAAQSAAVPLVAPVLITQLSVRGGAPGYTAMIDFRVTTVSGTNAVTVRETLPSSVSAPFCDRIDIYEVVEAGGDALAAGMAANNALIGDDAGDMLVYRSSIAVSIADPFTDNGFQRFYSRTSSIHTDVGTSFYVAACVKSGSALFSPIQN